MAVQTALGSVRMAQGRIREAVGAFETATALTHHWHESLVGVYASDLPIVATSSLASSLHLAGSPDRSRAYSEEVLRIGASRIHPVSRDVAVWSAALLHQWRRDVPRLQACLTQLAGSSHGIPELQAFSTIFAGWVAAVDAADSDAIARVREGIDGLRRMGAHLYEPYALGLLVEAHLVWHDVDQARTAVTEAMRGAHEAGEYFYSAELYRLRGEVMAASGDAAGAQDAFRQAVSVAHQQYMKAWELRAGLSLARLLARQGKVFAARRHLSAQYGSFAEGFDTPDLRAAAEHLADWGHSAGQ